MWSEFRAFIARGSAFDLAVGIIIGAAFTSVVNSLVEDILMPPLGMLTGGVDLEELYINLSGGTFASRAEAEAAGATTIDYGLFIGNVISFLLVAFAVFLLVRAYTRWRRAEAEAPPPPTEQNCPFCRLEIPIDASRCGFCTSQLDPSSV